jgi:hypothetical protein
VLGHEVILPQTGGGEPGGLLMALLALTLILVATGTGIGLIRRGSR